MKDNRLKKRFSLYFSLSDYLDDLKSAFLDEYKDVKNNSKVKRIILGIKNALFYEIGTTVNRIAYLIDKI